MEVLTSTSPPPRRGCNPILATQRSKLQNQRALLNQKLSKQMRLRAGAENLFNATSNPKIRETVALELSFVNSNLQLLKEELSEINASVEPYQNKSGKTVSIPMIPLGLKDTKDLEFVEVFQNYLSEHFGEDPTSYHDELADFADMRTSIRTPSRTYEGVSLLLEYYNQLYFLENRFFSPHQPLKVYFHWYDSITGVPSMQRSVSLEKASILFNIGALYSQVATRADRTRKKGVDVAIDAYQRAAGIFNYLRTNFSNAPCPDLSHSFLSALTYLMLAQAQECVLELKVLGGFEIQLGKCASIAQEAMKVSDKYSLTEKSFNVESVKTYVPYSWINMVQVKSHHYRALSHYYAALGLLDQHVAAEPVEISKLLSTLYVEVKDEGIPKPEDAAKRKEDRKRLGKSHLRQAIFHHERALQTHSLCKLMRTIDILKEYLQHAHNRSLSKFAEVDTEEDFFALVVAPNIFPFTEHDSKATPPAFGSVSSTDIFKRLGPLTVFSAHFRLGSPRSITLTDKQDSCGFTLHGNSPVTVATHDETARRLGLRNDDIVISIDDEDVKWRDHNYIADLISKKTGAPVVMKVVTVLGPVSSAPTSGLVNGVITDENQMHCNNNSNGNNNNGLVSQMRNGTNKRKGSIKKRYSFGFFQGMKLRPKSNRFSTVSDVTSGKDDVQNDKRLVSLQRTSTSSKSFLRAGGTVLRQKKDLSSEYRSNC
ncbi:rhophilin-2-like [Clavelina lepadiformis]|uniref:rhophilin-2-like n=1 Tax=Clavelina lepadiformis TaxID=159417 RepID=UPI004042C7B6